jgi:hypothetical protein
MGTVAAALAATLIGLGVRQATLSACDRGGLSSRQAVSDTGFTVTESLSYDAGSIGT